MTKDLEKEKKLAAKQAVKLIANDNIVGLGTGSTAYYAILEIGKMVNNGLKIKAVPTSGKTKALAQSLNISLMDINQVNSIDITIDGADEFTDDLTLIKGGGGALFQEKKVALLSKNLIIIADSSKKVAILGKFRLPIEVDPFALGAVLNEIKTINGSGKIRLTSDKPFITDQGNYIVDVDFGLIKNPILLSTKLEQIKGILGHGLFIGLAERVIMGINEQTITYKK